MKLNKTMKKVLAYVCAIAMVVTSITVHKADVSAIDYEGLTYTTASCEGGADISYSIVSNSIVGWAAPWYGDGGVTFQIVFAGGDVNPAADTTIKVNGTETPQGQGAVSLIDAGLVKINPTALPDNAYSEVEITTKSGSAVIVFKKGEATEGGEPVEPTSTSTADPTQWQEATSTWTTGNAWNIWAGNGGSARYKGANALNDFYINVTAATGAWSIQSSAEISGLTAGTLYEYTITVDSDKAGAYVGTKEDYSNSALMYTTLTEGTNALKGTFTANRTTAKLFLELGNEANIDSTLHVTGVEVKEYVSESVVEYGKNIVEDKNWQGWFEAESWANYVISESGTGYTLTDKNIGPNWYSLQTGIDNIEFLPAKYVCEFTLKAAAPKQFKVDNRTNGAEVFKEETAGEWTDNGDGTYSYKYKGTFDNDKQQFINVRVSLGYFADEENYEASQTATFEMSDFKIYAVNPDEEESTETPSEIPPETSTETPTEPVVITPPEGYTLTTANDWTTIGSWEIYNGTWEDGEGVVTNQAQLSYKEAEDGLDLNYTYVYNSAEWLIQCRYTFAGLEADKYYTYTIKANDTVVKTDTVLATADTLTTDAYNMANYAQGTDIKLTASIEEYVAPPAPELPDGKTVAEIISDSTYNIALGKNTTIYPGCAEGSQANLNDGSVSTGHCALSSGWGYTGESYAIIDLGDWYDASTIDMIIATYKDTADNDTVVGRSYSVRYSMDGANFTDVVVNRPIPTAAALDLLEDKATVDQVQAEGAVRFVQVYYPQTANYGMQLTEIAVVDTDGNLAKAELEKCEDAAGVTVKSEGLGEITVNVTAGENQEGYTYLVYVDNQTTAALSGIQAGVDYKITGIASGEHTVKVVAVNGNAMSEGIVSEPVTVKTIMDTFKDPKVNMALNKEVTLDSGASTEGTGSLTDGIIANDNFQTPTKGQAGSWMTVNLGKAYEAAVIDQVYVWFRYNFGGCYPENGGFEVQYSADGDEYVTVATVSQDELNEQRNAQTTQYFGVTPAEIDASGIETVQYVRIYFPEAVAYGAQTSEICILDTDGDGLEPEPIEVVGETLLSQDNGKVEFSWGQNDEQIALGQLYNVYIDDVLYLNNVAPQTVSYEFTTEGTHTIRITAVLGELETTGVTLTVVVGDETSSSGDETSTPDETTTENPTTPKPTPKPTTAAPTTARPTTAKPTTAAPKTTKKKVLSRTTVKKATKKKAAKKVSVTFKKVTGAKKYQVQISTTKKFKKVLVKKTVKKVKVTITNKKLRNKKKLYVRVKAVGAKKWSKVKKIKIKK